MYVIVKTLPSGSILFYQFSEDETDLYCNATATIYTIKKYSEEDKTRLTTSSTCKQLMADMNVVFKKVKISI